MSAAQIVDKEGEPIQVGDTVYARDESGEKKPSTVTDIIGSQREASRKGVEGAGKAVLDGQPAKKAAHDPTELVHDHDYEKIRNKYM